MWISEEKFSQLERDLEHQRQSILTLTRELRELHYQVDTNRSNHYDVLKRLKALPEKLGYKAVNIPEMQAETIYIKVK